MVNWKNEYDVLVDLLINQHKSYEFVGRKYGVCGTTIKKNAIKLGITLERRRIINKKEHFNKGLGEKRYCKYCGQLLGEHQYKFCSIDCQIEYQYKSKVTDWLTGKIIYNSQQTPRFIKRWLFEIHNNQCELCGWSQVNQRTGMIPLQIHHIDGDCTNNNYKNLQLLCPNCYSLTDTFGNSNHKSKRFHKKKITKSSYGTIGVNG